MCAQWTQVLHTDAPRGGAWKGAAMSPGSFLNGLQKMRAGRFPFGPVRNVFGLQLSWQRKITVCGPFPSPSPLALAAGSVVLRPVAGASAVRAKNADLGPPPDRWTRSQVSQCHVQSKKHALSPLTYSQC